MKQLKDLFITEAKSGMIDLGYSGYGTLAKVKYWINPTQSEIIRLVANSKHKSLRFIISQDEKNMIVWDAYFPVHSTFVSQYAKETGDKSFLDSYNRSQKHYGYINKHHHIKKLVVDPYEFTGFDRVYNRYFIDRMGYNLSPLEPIRSEDFQNLLLERGYRQFSYGDIGHERGHKVTAYALIKGRIKYVDLTDPKTQGHYSPDLFSNDEFDEIVLWGRIDHTDATISVSGGNQRHADFVMKKLLKKYPEYKIHRFGGTRSLNESSGRIIYMEKGIFRSGYENKLWYDIKNKQFWTMDRDVHHIQIPLSQPENFRLKPEDAEEVKERLGRGATSIWWDDRFFQKLFENKWVRVLIHGDTNDVTVHSSEITDRELQKMLEILQKKLKLIDSVGVTKDNKVFSLRLNSEKEVSHFIKTGRKMSNMQMFREDENLQEKRERGFEFTYLINPSKSELIGFFNRTKYQSVRLMYHKPTKDLYVWDANDGWHTSFKDKELKGFPWSDLQTAQINSDDSMSDGMDYSYVSQEIVANHKYAIEGLLNHIVAEYKPNVSGFNYQKGFDYRIQWIPKTMNEEYLYEVMKPYKGPMKNYISVGHHQHIEDIDMWTFENGKIRYTKPRNRYDTHAGLGLVETGEEIWGRVDHREREMSIYFDSNKQRQALYIAKLLKKDHPTYTLYMFQTGDKYGTFIYEKVVSGMKVDKYLVNPTSQELIGLFEKTKGAIRLIHDPKDGKIYAWSAKIYEMHQDFFKLELAYTYDEIVNAYRHAKNHSNTGHIEIDIRSDRYHTFYVGNNILKNNEKLIRDLIAHIEKKYEYTATKAKVEAQAQYYVVDPIVLKEEELEGGLADKMSVADIAKKHDVSVEQIEKQLKKGMKVEREHTDSVEKAREIVMDHLAELPDYYDRLATIEEERTKGGHKVSKKYLTKDKSAMKKEIDKFRGSDKYKEKWDADYKGKGVKSGERYETKKSDATKAYERMYKEEFLEESEKALRNKAKETGFSYATLKKVYDRGLAAWNTGHRPGVTQHQWAMGRVNSFITGKGGARKADKDLLETNGTSLKNLLRKLDERVDKENMPCNKPRRDVQGGKKSVVKACKDGEEKIVRFGDANMTIKKDDPERRKSFRARHKCDQKKDKFSAGYWSCKAW